MDFKQDLVARFDIDGPVNRAVKHIEEAWFDIVKRYCGYHPSCVINFIKEDENEHRILFAIVVQEMSTGFWRNGMENEKEWNRIRDIAGGWEKVYNPNGTIDYSKIKKLNL